MKNIGSYKIANAFASVILFVVLLVVVSWFFNTEILKSFLLGLQ